MSLQRSAMFTNGVCWGPHEALELGISDTCWKLVFTPNIEECVYCVSQAHVCFLCPVCIPCVYLMCPVCI